jgi:hypothetical protein
MVLSGSKIVDSSHKDGYNHKVRRTEAIITQIENVVTPSGNSGHVVVPKPRLEKGLVALKETENKTKGRKVNLLLI